MSNIATTLSNIANGGTASAVEFQADTTNQVNSLQSRLTERNLDEEGS